MAKTYAELSREIDALKVRAEVVRQNEKAGVVERIRNAIAVYGLTADELGFGRDATADAALKAGAAKSARPQSASAKALAGSRAPSVRYRDAAGNTWGGRGPKPKWLKAELAAGRALESFAADGSSAAGQSASEASSASPRAKPKGKGGLSKKKSFESVIRFRDDDGHAWSGRGPKPGWFTSALANGKTREQLAV